MMDCRFVSRDSTLNEFVATFEITLKASTTSLNANFRGACAGKDVRRWRQRSPTRIFADTFVGERFSCLLMKEATSLARFVSLMVRAASIACFIERGAFLSTSGAVWRNVDGALMK